jgi:hypothetical protein
MKTLVTISFALDLDEDELVDFVRKMDQGIYEGIKAKVDLIPDGTTASDLDELIDWYGASFTPRRSILEGILK